MELLPFNSVAIQGKEIAYLQDALTRDHLSGDGYYTTKCNELFEETLGVKKALLTTSCTHALEMTSMLLDIKEGDEVIVPSFTFVSSINSFVLRGAKPVFVDIRRDTLNLDENLLRNAISRRTKAVIVVHYAGVGCEMDTISKICKENEIALIEDNAHGLFGKYKNRFLGTFGNFATQSFHETKNFTCGEGGALFINSSTQKVIERAEVIREKGTNRSKFFRGDIQKYSWIDIGSSYLPSDMLAGFLYGQLEKRKDIQQSRQTLWHTYYSGLKEWAASLRIELPYVPDDCEQAYHMFYMIMPSRKMREQLIVHLQNSGLKAVFHYLPLHQSKMAKTLDAHNVQCKVTEDISSRIIRLPFFTNLELSSEHFKAFYRFKGA